MITRPSTPAVLADVCEELTREVMPLMPDSTAQIRLHMIIAVLGNCAVRAGNEIAWMKAEAADDAADVADATADNVVLRAITDIEPSGDLSLDAVARIVTEQQIAGGPASAGR